MAKLCAGSDKYSKGDKCWVCKQEVPKRKGLLAKHSVTRTINLEARSERVVVRILN